MFYEDIAGGHNLGVVCDHIMVDKNTLVQVLGNNDRLDEHYFTLGTFVVSLILVLFLCLYLSIITKAATSFISNQKKVS